MPEPKRRRVIYESDESDECENFQQDKSTRSKKKSKGVSSLFSESEDDVESISPPQKCRLDASYDSSLTPLMTLSPEIIHDDFLGPKHKRKRNDLHEEWNEDCLSPDLGSPRSRETKSEAPDPDYENFGMKRNFVEISLVQIPKVKLLQKKDKFPSESFKIALDDWSEKTSKSWQEKMSPAFDEHEDEEILSNKQFRKRNFTKGAVKSPIVISEGEEAVPLLRNIDHFDAESEEEGYSSSEGGGFFESEAEDDGFVVSDSEPVDYDSELDALDMVESYDESESDEEVKQNSSEITEEDDFARGRLYLTTVHDKIQRLYVIPIEYFRKSKLRFLLLYFILNYRSSKEIQDGKRCVLPDLDVLRLRNSFPKIFDDLLEEFKAGLSEERAKKIFMIWQHLLRIKINEGRLRDVPLRNLSLDEENYVSVTNEVSFFNPVDVGDIVAFFCV